MSTTNLDPQRPYSGQIVHLLRDAIVRGHLEPCFPLSEAAVAEATGISRTPIREALRTLASERLVEIFPQAGTRVAPLRLDLIREGAFIRSALELANVDDLVELSSMEDLGQLESLVAQQYSAILAQSLVQYVVLDDTFHQMLFKITRRSATWSLLAGAKLHLDRVRYLMVASAPDHAIRSLDEHRTILNRLAARDSVGILGALKSHLAAASIDVIELRRKLGDDRVVD